jgi:hypothetical protein
VGHAIARLLPSLKTVVLESVFRSLGSVLKVWSFISHYTQIE